MYGINFRNDCERGCCVNRVRTYKYVLDLSLCVYFLFFCFCIFVGVVAYSGCVLRRHVVVIIICTHKSMPICLVLGNGSTFNAHIKIIYYKDCSMLLQFFLLCCFAPFYFKYIASHIDFVLCDANGVCSFSSIWYRLRCDEREKWHKIHIIWRCCVAHRSNFFFFSPFIERTEKSVRYAPLGEHWNLLMCLWPSMAKRNEDLYWMSFAGMVKIAIDIALCLKICLFCIPLPPSSSSIQQPICMLQFLIFSRLSVDFCFYCVLHK